MQFVRVLGRGTSRAMARVRKSLVLGNRTRLVLPDGRWSWLGTWRWRARTGRFARVELAEVIYGVRWATMAA